MFIYHFIKPTKCPKCGKRYKVDSSGRCVYCGADLKKIKF